MPSFVEELVTGMLTPGVNSSIVTVVNGAGIMILLLVCPLYLAAGTNATLMMLPIPFLTIGLLISFNWLAILLCFLVHVTNHSSVDCVSNVLRLLTFT